MTEADTGGTRSAARPPGTSGRRPPPRPPLTSDLRPPSPHVVPPAPWTVRAAAWCWVAAALAGVIGLIAAALDLAGLRQRLLDSAAAADPATDQELLREGVDTTVLAVVGPLAVLTVLGLAALLLYLRRRSIWSRVLLVLGLLTVAADVLAHDLLAGGPDVDRSAVLVQAGLVTVGLALLFLPRPSRDWSREPRG